MFEFGLAEIHLTYKLILVVCLLATFGLAARRQERDATRAARG